MPTNVELAESIATNKSMIDSLFSPNDGMQKQAQADLSQWFQTYQRSDGVIRKLSPPETVDESMFAEAVNTRDPFIIRTMKPRSAGALSVNYDTGTVSEFMYADKYQILLNRIFTPKYRTDKIYLTAYKGSLVDVFHDLMLMDILAKEDRLGVDLYNVCIGTKNVVNTDIGVKQYIEMGTSVTTQSVMDAVSGMTYSSDNLSPSQALVHRSFWWKLIATFRADWQGRDMVNDVLVGKTGVLEESLAGINWKTALDYSLVPVNTMYVFAAPEFTGDFVTYQDAQVFTEVTNGYLLEMLAHETIGYAVPNRAAVFRADFTGTAGSWQ